MIINRKKITGKIIAIFDSPITILIASLVALTWLQGKYLFSGTDTFLPLSRIESIKNLFYTWSTQSTGMPMSAQSVMLPYGLFLIISEKVGLSLILTQSFWFYYLLALSGISMYLLSKEVFMRSFNTIPRLIPIFTSLLYMANPFVTSMASAYSYLWLTYAAMPLKIFLILRVVNNKSSFKTIFYSVVIWNLTASSQYTNPKYLILDLLPIGLLIVMFALLNKNAKEKSLIFFALLFLTNTYWLLPSFKMIGGAFKDTRQAYSEISLTRDAGHNLNSSVGIVRGLTLTGLWALPGGTKEVPYFKFYEYLNSTLILLISLIPITLAILAVIFSKNFKHKNTYIFFGILNVFSFLGMMGSHPSVVGIDAILKRIPLYLEIFSYPYQIYGIFFIVSLFVLAALGAFAIIDRYRLSSNKTKSVLLALIILPLVFLYGKQVWTGELISPRIKETNYIMPTNLYRIPGYYFDLRNRMTVDKGQYRILSIPYSKTSGMVYLWDDGYAGTDITPGFIGNVIYGSNHLVDSLLEKIYTKNAINDEISNLGISAIIFHNDIHELFFKDPDISERDLEESLEKSNIDYNKESFGKIDLYSFNIKPTQLVYIDSGVNSTVNIKFERINNTQIDVFISGINTSERLVFSETYNDFWTLSTVDNKDHFRASGYANGWTIDPKKICDSNRFCIKNSDGSYDISLKIEFEPQKLLYLGIFISSLTYLICMLFLTIFLITKKNINE